MSFKKISNFEKPQYKFNLKLECFLFASSKVGDVRLYTFFPSKKSIQSVFDDLKKDFPSCEVKVLGAPEYFSSIESKCTEFGFTLLKSIPRSGSYEVIFEVASKKLMLSKEVPLVGGKAEKVEAKTTVDEPKAKEPKRPIRVMIVDDSSTIINLLTKVFQSDKDIQVVATCENPLEAEQKIREFKPDVITMDIHMPGIDGVALVKKIYPIYKLPIIMISSISLEEGPQVLMALENGAVDYIQKPTFKDLDQAAPLIIERVKVASEMQLSSRKVRTTPRVRSSKKFQVSMNRLIVIGASTGGTEALRAVLEQLPAEIPPILIVQHIPPVFSTAFAKRLNELCAFPVKEAADGDKIEPGRVYIAPGGKQMGVVSKATGELFLSVNDDGPVNRHKPSVDYMFKTVVDLAIPNVVGAILTGMGADGAREMLRLRTAGARTIAQNQETCIVYGMPREAVERGAAEFVLPLDEISEKLMYLCTDAANSKRKAG